MKANLLRVLLVEDNKLNQVLASHFLNRWGIEVWIANNGEEALEMINRKSVHLVLMDMQMPVMDGFEATSKIRSMEDEYFKTIPIIACTASGLINDQEEAMMYGMTDFISKPIAVEELREKMEKYVLAGAE